MLNIIKQIQWKNLAAANVAVSPEAVNGKERRAVYGGYFIDPESSSDRIGELIDYIISCSEAKKSNRMWCIWWKNLIPCTMLFFVFFMSLIRLECTLVLTFIFQNSCNDIVCNCHMFLVFYLFCLISQIVSILCYSGYTP